MSRAPISLEDAQSRLLALATPLPAEHRPVPDALGCYLAHDVAAARTQPAADMSAMDGYAVRAEDLAGPWRLIGESAAGHPFAGVLNRGETVRVSTGALMPAGGGIVILQEDIAADGTRIVLAGTAPAPPERHIRVQGLDFRVGDTLLRAGTRVGAVEIALAIAAGHAHLPVHRPPSVAVLDTGDELSTAAMPAEPHRLPASNGPMLTAMIAALPARARRIGPVADNMEALAQAFAAADTADLIVTTGGASVGDHDLIRPALMAWGANIDFWRVAIKPGKPLLVATRQRDGRRQLILGLPGNPASAYVTGFLFLLPLLRSMLGARHPLPLRIRSTLAQPLRAGGSRREFLRAYWDGATIAPAAMQDSGVLATLAMSNALIDWPAGAAPGGVGESVTAYLLGNG